MERLVPKNKYIIYIAGASLAGLLLSSLSFAQQKVPQNLNISGGLYDSTGAVVTSASVNFKIEILDEGSHCVLYSEEHLSKNLSNTKGAFSLMLGSGSSPVNKLDGSGTLDARIFQNSGSTGAFTDCPGGVTLSSGSVREIRVSYDLNGGSAYVAMSPVVPIVSSAYAMVAETLQGHSASDFLLTNANTSLVQSSLEYLFTNTNYASLKALVDGTSSQYVLSTPTSNINANSHQINNVSDPSSAQDAATKNYSDTNIGGKDFDVAGVGAGIGGGRTIVWDSAQNKWVTSATGSVGLVAAGSGLLGGNITSSGTLSVDVGTTANKILQLDSLARIPTVDGSLLTNISAKFLLGREISATPPVDTQVLAWNGLSSLWEPVTPNGGTITALNGDVVASGTGNVTATIQPDAVTSAKINSTNVFPNRLLITDATTGASVQYASCALDEILQWTASGWKCKPVSLMLGNVNASAGIFGNGTQVAQVTVDLQGRVTAITNVNIAFPVESVNGKTGAVTLLSSDITDLGTAATKNVGTNAGQVLQFLTNNSLPALDGSLLTNLSASANQIIGKPLGSTAPTAGQVLAYNGTTAQWEANDASAGSVTSITGGQGLLGGTINSNGTLSVDVGTTANKILQLDASARIPAVDGSQLTNVSASANQIIGKPLGSTAPTAGQLLTYNSTAAEWEAQSPGVYSQWETNGTSVYYTAGNVGIGTASPSVRFNVMETKTDTAAIFTGTSFTQLTVAPASSSSTIFTGSAAHVGTSGAQSMNNASGFVGQVYHGGTNVLSSSTGVSGQSVNNANGTVTSSYGSQSYSDNASTGTINSSYGTYAFAQNSSTGTVDSATGGYFQVLDVNGTPKTTNGYGLVIGTVQAINKWSLVSTDASAPSYFAGSVGIGTISPNYKLDVAGTVNAQALMINGVAVGTSSSPWLLNGSNTYYTSGNVGIGTTNPLGLLHLKGPSAAAYIEDGPSNLSLGPSGIWLSKVESASLGSGEINQIELSYDPSAGSASYLDFGFAFTNDAVTNAYTSSTAPMVFNVATDPSLEIRSGGTAVISHGPGPYLSLRSTDQSVFADDRIGSLKFDNYDVDLTTSNTFAEIEVQAAQTISSDSAAGNLLFKTTDNSIGALPTEKMRISSSGNVGIGTTSPVGILDVEGGTAAPGASGTDIHINAQSGGTGTSTNGGNIYLAPGTSPSNGPGYVYIGNFGDLAMGSGSTIIFGNGNPFITGHTSPDTLEFGSNGSVNMHFDPSGNVGIGTTTPERLLHVNGPMRLTPAALPGTPAAGDIAIDSTASNTLKYYDGSAWQSVVGGGGGTPGGSDTQIQFNNAGSFGGSSNLIWDNTNGYLGIGGPPSYRLTSSDVRTDLTGAAYGAVFGLSASPASNSTAAYSSFVSNAMSGTSANMSSLSGASLAALHMQTGTVTSLIGASAQAVNYAGGTAGSAVGGYFTVNNSSTGTITNAIGVVGAVQQGSSAAPMTTATGGSFSVTKSGSSVITTAYGVKIGPVEGAATYGLYQSDATAKNYFAGNVGVGTDSPGRTLHVNGGLRLTPLATAPTSPAAGDLYVDSTASNVLKYYDGSAWQSTGGGGGGGGLTNFSEAVSGAAPNATVPVVSLTPNNAATDVDIALVPKGAGALTAQIADGTSTAGDKRGTHAVDWQSSRSASTQVASGPFSVIAGGQQNSATNAMASVLGGMQNTAGDVASVVGGGTQNSAGSFGSGVFVGMNNSVSTGITSFIGAGNGNSVTGQSSFVGAGYTNSATAYTSGVGSGSQNTASGQYSFVVGGVHNTASGDNSSVLGGDTNTSSGFRSAIAGGAYNATSGRSSFAVGDGNTAGGDYSAAIGFGSLAPSMSQMSLGMYNVTTGGEAADSWVGTDPILTVGNGQDDLSRSTALQILKNGNVGIGTTSPTQKLEVNGTVKATAFQGDGSALTGISAGPAGSNTQIQFNNSGAMGASPNLVWDNTNSRLGIGKTPSGFELDVAGSAKFSNSVNVYSTGNVSNTFQAAGGPTLGSNILLNGTDGSAALVRMQLQAGGQVGAGLATIQTIAAHDLVLATNSTERLRISSSGNVGIGTTTPGEKLQVAGNIKMTGTGNGIVFPDGTSQTTAATGGAASGSVTTAYTPTGAPSGYPPGVSNIAATNLGSANGIGAFVVVNTVNDYPLGQKAYFGAVSTPGGLTSPNFVFGQSTGSGYAERMRIDSSGNVGIGTTTPSRLLEVAGPMHIQPSSLPISPTAGDIAIDSGAGNAFKYYNGTAWASAAGVTSVGLSMPSIFSVTNSPVTGTGTLTASLATQSANRVFAGPASGGAVAPTFRALVANDLPTVTVAKGGTGRTSFSNSAILTTDGSGAVTAGATCTNTGEVLQWNGSAWACGTSTSSQWTTGTGSIYYNGGKVGIGTANPTNSMDIYDSSGSGDPAIRLYGSGGTPGNTSAVGAGTGANVTGVGTVAWSAPGNVTASDSTSAVANLGFLETSNYLVATGFGFSIPAGATVTGVVVSFRKKADIWMRVSDAVYLFKGGSPITASKTTGTLWDDSAYSTSTLGSSSDTWGATLSGLDVNSSDFGVGIVASASTAKAMVDYVTVQVYYSDPVGNPNWTVGSSRAQLGAFQISNGGSLAANPRLLIDGVGNVGIGTTNPGAKLEVNGTSSTTLKIVDGNQGAGKVLTSDANGVASWASPSSGGSPSGVNDSIQYYSAGSFSGSSSFLYNDTYKRLTIGSTTIGADQMSAIGSNSTVYTSTGMPGTPTTGYANISVSNTSNTDGAGAYLRMVAKNSFMNLNQAYIGAISTSGPSSYSPSLVFGRSSGNINYVETMRIDPTGNVGIGTTSPGARLDISSGTANISGLKFTNFNSTSPTSTGQAVGVDASGNLVTIAGGGGGSGDFMKNGSVAMTGDLNLGGQHVTSTDGILRLGYPSETIALDVVQVKDGEISLDDNGIISSRGGRFVVGSGNDLVDFMGSGGVQISGGNLDLGGSSMITSSAGTVTVSTTNVNIMNTGPFAVSGDSRFGGPLALFQRNSDPTGISLYSTLYAKNDGKLYYRNGTGTITDLTAGGGGSGQWASGGSGIYYNSGSVNIGQATTSTTEQLKITQDVGNVSNKSGIFSNVYLHPTAPMTSSTTAGIRSRIEVDQAGGGTLVGIQNSQNAVSAAADQLIGVDNIYDWAGANSPTNAMGTRTTFQTSIGTNLYGNYTSFVPVLGYTKSVGNYVLFDSASQSGAFSNAYGVYVDGNKGSGAFGNMYGLYVGSINGGSSAYAVYSASPSVQSYFAGNVGIGTASPDAKLQVYGSIVSKTNSIASGAAVDLSLSNTHTLANVGGSAITVSNLSDGGQYTLIITDGTARTYTFTGCTTSYFRPANAATTASTRSIYGLVTIKNGANWDCYINWQSGYAP